MARSPLGVYSRNTPDWFLTGMYGQGAFQGASAGNLSYVCLYNDATDGSFLVVYQLWVNVQVGSSVIESAFGKHGSFVRQGACFAFENAPGFGQVYVATSASCFGTEYGIVGGSGTPYNWPHAWPVARVPAGQMLAVHCDTVNNFINCSFAWMISRE